MRMSTSTATPPSTARVRFSAFRSMSALGSGDEALHAVAEVRALDADAAPHALAHAPVGEGDVALVDAGHGFGLRRAGLGAAGGRLRLRQLRDLGAVEEPR